MLRNIIYILAGIMFVSCTDEPQMPVYSGIASVERNDSVFALHYYDYTFVIEDDGMHAGLRDSARVTFRVRPRSRISESDSVLIFRADVIELSDDITSALRFDLQSADLPAGGIDTALCTPVDIHVTRDYRRLDFFNIRSYYYTKPDNGDVIGLFCLSDEQTCDTATTLWLRHIQQSGDSLTQVQYNTISVPLNVLIADTASERMNIILKRFGAESDTIVESYVYSFHNHIW